MKRSRLHLIAQVITRCRSTLRGTPTPGHPRPVQGPRRIGIPNNLERREKRFRAAGQGGRRSARIQKRLEPRIIRRINESMHFSWVGSHGTGRAQTKFDDGREQGTVSNSKSNQYRERPQWCRTEAASPYPRNGKWRFHAGTAIPILQSCSDHTSPLPVPPH